jgi:Tfp pilus assembly protein PilO
MLKSFNFNRASMKDPRVSVRLVLGVLLLANLVAAIALFKPWGGSAQDLEERAAALRRELPQRQAALARTRAIVEKVAKARAEGDQFMARYMLDGQTSSSTLLTELDRAASQVKLQPMQSNFQIDPIEGSDTLGIVSITAVYEGAYPNLAKFINELDRSPRFLIIESLSASPQPVGPNVNVSFKLKAFLKDETGGLLQ